MIQNDQATNDGVIDADTSNSISSESLELRLCLYGGKMASVQKTLNSSQTLEELHKVIRSEFHIESDKETMLWIDSKKYKFNHEDVISPSKSENDIQHAFSWSSNPPVPPPMPNSSFQPLANNGSPNVVTRQAANSMNNNVNKLAGSMQDNHTNNNNNNNINSKPSTTLTTSTSESPIKPASENNDKNGQESTQRTLAECGIKTSSVVTLEVMNSDGTWPSSRPRFGTVSTRSSKAQPGLCGLSNMGNTCFMNSALQCLSNTPHLTNYILNDKFIDDINTSNPLGMHGEIARTYSELIKSMWSGNHSSILPREFKCAVSRFAPQFNGFNQQDCQELMAFLLDGLHEDLNRIRDKPYIEINNGTESRPDEVVAQESWELYKKRNDSVVVDTFHALLKSTLVCPGCNLVSVTFDPFCYLSLPLPVKRDKQTSLSFFPVSVSSSTNSEAAASSTGAVSSTTSGDGATNGAESSTSSTPSSSEPSSSTSTIKNKTNSGDDDNAEAETEADAEDEENSSAVAADTSSTGDKVETSSSSTSKVPLASSTTTSSGATTTTTPTPTKAFTKPVLQLEDCIAQFTSLERLGADDPWYCPKCKKHQQATKKFDIWSLPKILIIHLKRFSFSRSWRDKIDTLVEFPVTNLDMSKYALNPSQKKKRHIYNLIGVANHYGGLGGGHYTAFAKNFMQDAWYTFDDALVSPTSASSVVTRSAYVLFYQLQEETS